MASKLFEDISKKGNRFLNTGDDDARQQVIAAASALIRELENPGEQLARIGWGEPSRNAALRTAFELGLLQKLATEPQSSSELASGTEADPALVARTMKHLAANGIVKEVDVDKYIGTPFSMATNDPTLGAGLVYSFEGMIPTFQGLSEFLAKTNYQEPSDADNGPVQQGLRTGKPFFAILKENARLGSAFNNFMAGYSTSRPFWTDFYPIEERLLDAGRSSESSGPLLVDVGGGLGHELLRFGSKHPNIPGQLVVQDLPSVIDEAKNSGNLPSTIKAVAHDFFESQPVEYRGARFYFMRLVLHDWPDSKCAVILSHLKDAMKAGISRLIINEAVLRDMGAPWQQTSLDWTMMGMLVSRERTESQWRKLLTEAGLEISGIWHKDTESVIEAVLQENH